MKHCSQLNNCNFYVWLIYWLEKSLSKDVFQTLNSLVVNNFWKGIFKKLWKKNTWNIRLLVDESFVWASQRTSVLYWRLTDLEITFSVGMLPEKKWIFLHQQIVLRAKTWSCILLHQTTKIKVHHHVLYWRTSHECSINTMGSNVVFRDEDI